MHERISHEDRLKYLIVLLRGIPPRRALKGTTAVKPWGSIEQNIERPLFIRALKGAVFGRV
ncbi:MAG: hypothetical protein PHC33_04515 [Candidatus Omnitrophica bacterium]|nr:hypothetical protein [Candidatus Omnitrophota bacterium]